MSNRAYNMTCYFIKYVPNLKRFMSFPVNLQTTELLIYFESFFIMIHDNKVTLIRRCILRIIGNVNNETHGCIWHAAPMSKLKEELEHHTEHCQMFSHHIMFIGAFITRGRRPSILFTFILRRCNVFIISVIVVIRRSSIFTEHYLHLVTVRKISIHAQLVSSMWCPNEHISIYEPWLTRLSFVHHSLTWR